MSWSGLPERVEKYIMPEPMSGCWLWIGGLRDKKDGYGGVGYGGKIHRAHRLVYTLLRGKVSSKLTIDHLCRNRLCCNPDHLEVVSWGINIARGEGIAAKNKKKTHCVKGHEYTPENTYYWGARASRFCRACGRYYKKLYKDRMRVKK